MHTLILSDNNITDLTISSLCDTLRQNKKIT